MYLPSFEENRTFESGGSLLQASVPSQMDTHEIAEATHVFQNKC
jgi:hypothetical protein